MSGHPLLHQRVHVSDEYYTGVAIVLEYDANAPGDLAGPFYCHLLDLCHHEGVDEQCEHPDDECMGEYCRGWYAIQGEHGGAA